MAPQQNSGERRIRYSILERDMFAMDQMGWKQRRAAPKGWAIATGKRLRSRGAPVGISGLGMLAAVVVSLGSHRALADPVAAVKTLDDVIASRNQKQDRQDIWASATPELSKPQESPKPASAPTSPEKGSGPEPEIQWSHPAPKAATPAAPGAVASLGNVPTAMPAMEMEVPVKDDGLSLGQIAVRVSPNGDAMAHKERFIQLVTPILRDEPLAALKAAPDIDGYVRLAALPSNTLGVRFDPGLVEVQVAPTVDQRAKASLSGSNARQEVLSENMSKPAQTSAYINTRIGVDYANTSLFSTDGTFGGRVGFDGAARRNGVVYESTAALAQDTGFARSGTRFVYDMPEDVLRLSGGDITPPKANYQSGSDLLGITIEKTYQKLKPGADIRPTGSHSFRLDRPSDVEVINNGAVVQRLHLRPGEYDLKDLPLASGANAIALAITDDLGQKRTLNMTLFSGRALLAPDVSEWAFSTGLATGYATGGPSLASGYSTYQYNFASPAATGFYRQGVTPSLTAEGHAQADLLAAQAGAGASFQTAFGFWELDAAGSFNYLAGPGYAARVNYDLSNVKGFDGIKRNFRVGADYRSPIFGGINLKTPLNNIALNVQATYSQDLPWELSGGLTANWSLGYGVTPDRMGVGVSLGRSLGPSLTSSLSLGVDHAYEGVVAAGQQADVIRAMVRVGYRMDERTNIDSSFDAGTGAAQTACRHQEGSGVGAWNAQVSAENKLPNGTMLINQEAINASASYTANRADIGISHNTGMAGLDMTTVDQRTSFTMGTSVAWADGAFAVGRPISNGFAIVAPHPSLEKSTITIGGGGGGGADGQTALSDWLGPPLVTDVSSYSASHVSYNVDDMPVGYDLGASAFDMYGGYKTGYKLTVGSDYTVTAFGSVVDAEGQPVPLLTGTAYQEDHPDDHKVTVFTNRAGKFGAQGLRPGKWVLEMATEPPARYVLEIPPETQGLAKLDVLKPIKGDPSAPPGTNWAAVVAPQGDPLATVIGSNAQANFPPPTTKAEPLAVPAAAGAWAARIEE
jgi:outer membrane usher protein